MKVTKNKESVRNMTEEEYMSEEEWDEWLSQGSPRNEDGDPILLNDPEDDPRIEDGKLREFEYEIGKVFEPGEVFEPDSLTNRIASKRAWKSKAYKWYEKTFRKGGVKDE